MHVLLLGQGHGKAHNLRLQLCISLGWEIQGKEGCLLNLLS